MMRFILLLGIVTLQNLSALESNLVPFDRPVTAPAIELKNDKFVDAGGSAILQMGFVKGEKAGIWVKVPQNVPYFKADSFRVLIGNPGQTQGGQVQIFFQMGTSKEYVSSIPKYIENAANITVGPYWNDIPALGSSGNLSCVMANELVGASIEFTQDGTPSVYRDEGPINVAANVLMAIPGGWNFSNTFGLTGNWILRIVGHEATKEECGKR